MAGLKTIVTLSFVLAIGFLLVILSSALWKNYLPLSVVAAFLLAPIPNWLFDRTTTDVTEGPNESAADFGRFLTGVFVVTGIALPIVLAHAGLIVFPAMLMSIAGGLLIYGTILTFTIFFQGREDL